MIVEMEVLCPSRDDADRIAATLLQRRLIGSASRGEPVVRLFNDGHGLAQQQEVPLKLRTLPELGDRVEEAILELHPEGVPLILRHSVWANLAYETWLRLEISTSDR